MHCTQPAIPRRLGPCLPTRACRLKHTCLLQLSQLGAWLAAQQPVGGVEDAYHVATGLTALPADVLVITPPEGSLSLASPVRAGPYFYAQCCFEATCQGRLVGLP